MSQKRSFLTAALLAASPLAADWQHWDLYLGHPSSIWDTCERGYYAEVDYLLWYMNEEGLSLSSTYTYSNPNVRTSVPVQNIEQKDHFFKNKWNSGVRATLGVKPENHSWDLRASYTFYYSDVKRTEGPEILSSYYSTDFRIGSVVVPDFTQFEIETVPFITVVKNEWSLNFNQVDVELGKEFSVFEDLTLRPYLGMRGLFVTQRIFLKEIYNIPVNSNEGFVSMNPYQNFNGFGTKGGFDLSLHLFSCLDFYGNFGASIFWGRTKVKQPYSEVFNTYAVVSSDDIVTMVNSAYDIINRSHHISVLNVDLGLGLVWNQWFCCGRQLLTLKFGWEQHFYTNMNQLQNFLIGINRETPINTSVDQNIYRGDLSLSGFVFGVSYLY